MSTPPTRNAILNLYASTLRASRAFSSYNFRQYFIRRTKSNFEQIRNEQDAAKLTAFYNEARKELAVLKRGAVVNQLYGGWKLVVEDQKPERERGVN
ncbi:hypothetical protein NEOLEDRAFT_1058936 [Neolentinus lepideus HHB14362 ss-1]|uniref:Complex 1 LYR protein domain-containing protein n=1 Tax=Neolentinus lepideus HHB14362 ss-1 TaxID=1314782 RepID=A0A165UIE1_9AGAM|nr:hypothetical protein NEOLEDRAFT_1058936 [Neolentinus lepideus HHB14362 ss-1]